jgi:hypothetical protein
VGVAWKRTVVIEREGAALGPMETCWLVDKSRKRVKKLRFLGCDGRIGGIPYGFGLWTFCPSPAPPKLLIALFAYVKEHSAMLRESAGSLRGAMRVSTLVVSLGGVRSG